jgi:hypothetical protein
VLKGAAANFTFNTANLGKRTQTVKLEGASQGI